MAFSTNYEQNTLLPEGDYECIIKAAYLTATKGGTEYFSVRFIIRNDVPQKYQNKNIFHAIWKKREPTADDNKVEGFSYKQLMNLAKSAKLPKGKNYETLNEFGEDLVGKCVKVVIEHNEYNGETQEKVRYTAETKYPDCKHAFKATEPLQEVQTKTDEEVSVDDDLPF